MPASCDYLPRWLRRLAGMRAPHRTDPLIRPAATFSRVGEKGQSCVTSPEAGRGRPGPAGGSRAGEGWVVGCLAAGRGPLIRPAATFSRVGEKGQSCVTSPEAGRGRPGPAGGSRAGEGRVVGCRAAGRGPLIRPAATFSRVGEKGQSCVTSPEAGRGRPGPAGGSRAGEGRVVGCRAAGRGPLIRPAATFSRVGEKGQGCVTSPEAGRGRPGPAGGSRAGEGWVVGCLAAGRGPLIRPAATFSRVGEKGQGCVTSPEAGRGRPGPAGGSRAGEGRAGATRRVRRGDIHVAPNGLARLQSPPRAVIPAPRGRTPGPHGVRSLSRKTP